MLALELFPPSISDYYELHEWKHAAAILHNDFPDEWQDVDDVLSAFRLKESYFTTPGGSKSKISKQLDDAFTARGWFEDTLTTQLTITVERSGEEAV